MLVPTGVERTQIMRQPEQESQFVKIQAGPGEVTRPSPSVGGVDQALQHVHGRGLNPVAQQEIPVPRISRYRRHEPQYEPVMHRKRRALLRAWFSPGRSVFPSNCAIAPLSQSVPTAAKGASHPWNPRKK